MASRPVPLIDIIDTGTFDSAWYWLLLLLAWWWSGHRTMGVPHEVMVIAARRGGAMAAHVEALVRAEVARLSAIMRPAGVALAALGGFVAGLLATAGFWGGSDFAQGLCLIVLPQLAVTALHVRLAFRLERAPLEGSALHRALSRQRIWDQLVWSAAATVAAALGLLHILPRLFGLG